MTTPIQALAGCRLLVFDLDGTVYGETYHFKRFAEELAARMPEENRGLFNRVAETVFDLELEKLPNIDGAYDPW